jgi:hypothetical protein
MSFTMMALLATSQVSVFYGQILIQAPAKYNTESVVVMFDDNGDPVWDRRISIANATSKILFEPDSISLTKCSSGGYALVSPILCQRDRVKSWGVYLCRLDDSGEISWSRIFEEIDIELGLSVVETQSGELVIAGTSWSSNGGLWTRGVFVMRTDSSGNPRWTRNYPELEGVWGHSLVSCNNGDVAIAGTTEIYSDMKSNVTLARIDESGALLWTRSIGGSLNDAGRSLLECDDGGFIVVGSTQKEEGNEDVFLIRTASDGSIMWNRTHEDEGASIGLSVCRLDDGGFAATGLRKLSSNDINRALFMRASSGGEVLSCESLWYSSEYRAYGQYDDCCGHAIAQYDKGFIIAGKVRINHLTDDYEMMILGTDSSGSLLWNSTYGGDSWTTACSIVTHGDIGYVIAGVRIEQVG